MAIGTISSPSSWANGTVAVPTWFQNVQDNINAFIGATESFKALVVDGTGGAVVAGVAGTITASSSIQGTVLKPTTSANGNAMPTTATTAKTLYADNFIPMWGVFTYTGGTSGTLAIVRGFNINSITRTSVGLYNITPVTNMSFANYALVGSIGGTTGGLTIGAQSGNVNAGSLSFNMYNSSGSAADPTGSCLFSIVVIGG